MPRANYTPQDITMEIYTHATQEGRKNVENVLNKFF